MFNRIQNPKTRGLIKLISGIIVLALMLFVFFFDFSEENIDTIKNFGRCAKEGESIGSCKGCVPKCCGSLKGMAPLKYDGECIKLPAPGIGATCSKCGNGVCDAKNDEDECNCPKDCK